MGLEVTNEKTSIKELREKVKADREARTAKLDVVNEGVERRRLEEELKLPAFEVEHGTLGRDIEAVFSPKTGAMVVVKTPDEANWQLVETKFMKEKATPQDLVALIYASLVYPSKSELGRIFVDTPGHMQTIANAIARLAGVAKKESEGK